MDRLSSDIKSYEEQAKQDWAILPDVLAGVERYLRIKIGIDLCTQQHGSNSLASRWNSIEKPMIASEEATTVLGVSGLEKLQAEAKFLYLKLGPMTALANLPYN